MSVEAEHDVSQPPVVVRLFLLLLLPLCAGLIYLDSLSYDPGLLDFKEESNTTMESVFPNQLNTLKRIATIRHFSPDNLYEYINGHAEFFLGFGFKGLSVAEYAAPKKLKEPLLTVDRYDMGKNLHAFGVLMDETPKGAHILSDTMIGYQTNRTLAFIHGPYFIKLSAFQDALPLLSLAETFKQSLPKDQSNTHELFNFPDLGKVVATRYIKENYRGLSFLTNVLERTFENQGNTIQAFLIVEEKTNIKKLKKTLLEFFKSEEILFTLSEDPLPGRVMVQDPYEGTWFFVANNERLLGVFGLSEHPLPDTLKAFITHGQTKRALPSQH